MAFGGVLMAYIAGSELSGSYPLPSVDLLRFSNGFGFIVTGIPGMAATALCIAVLAGQARRAGVFGPKMAAFSWLVAAVLLLSTCSCRSPRSWSGSSSASSPRAARRRRPRSARPTIAPQP
jgi:hypothetical protein